MQQKKHWDTLPDDILLFAYKEVILYVETSVADNDKGFNITLFKKQLDKKRIPLELQTNTIGNIKTNPQKLCYMNYINNKSSGVASILCHLRNSFAHGRFEIINFSGEDYLQFDDTIQKGGYKGKYSMTGSFLMKDFHNIIEALKSARK